MWVKWATLHELNTMMNPVRQKQRRCIAFDYAYSIVNH